MAMAVAFTLAMLVAAVGARMDPEELQWRPATATWYGAPDGSGSDGGACGYETLVDTKPYQRRTGAVSPLLFKNGEGCGACYKVKCLDEKICAKRPVTIIVTDECPGGYCSSGRAHFDLSGAAFGRMAVIGKTPDLLNTGVLNVLYRRTPCKYPGRELTFRVNEGATNYWFSVLVEYEDGEGDVGAVQLQQAGSLEWMQMNHLWGANWALIGGPFRAPMSLRVSTLSTNETVTAQNIIPSNWQPSTSYTSKLNFLSD